MRISWLSFRFVWLLRVAEDYLNILGRAVLYASFIGSLAALCQESAYSSNEIKDKVIFDNVKITKASPKSLELQAELKLPLDWPDELRHLGNGGFIEVREIGHENDNYALGGGQTNQDENGTVRVTAFAPDIGPHKNKTFRKGSTVDVYWKIALIKDTASPKLAKLFDSLLSNKEKFRRAKSCPTFLLCIDQKDRVKIP